jgi:hypothetical protein
VTMTKHNIGTNDDGTTRFLFTTEKHAVVTGPILGSVVTADGRAVDVSEAVIEVESPAEAAEVAHLIALRYHAEGHPTNPGFRYEFADLGRVPTDADVEALVSGAAVEEPASPVIGTPSFTSPTPEV